ncbi:MAG TPA: hypothetical protein VK571_09160 [Gemmatimonadaceae bacterium]|nr:hypothetical protein [Gemmatimonadaceae bacterium]
MALNDRELALLTELRTGASILVFLHAARRHWGKVADLARVVGFTERIVNIELRKLEAKGILRRHEKGGANHTRLVRFEVLRSDLEIRAAGISRSEHSLPRARASDPEQSENRQTDGEGPKDRGEGRAELRNALVHRVADRWRLTTRSVTPGLLRLLNAGATERELLAFLADAERGTHRAFNGVDERLRFGCSCTAERFAIWRASRASMRSTREPDAAPAVPALSEAERAEAEKLRARYAGVARTESDAIAELVKHVSRGR